MVADADRSRRREIFGYCMYDFANSSYTTLIITVAYAVYFRQVVVGDADPRGDLWWSLTQVAAYLILILSAPVFGALADYSGRKKRFLLMTTVQTVVACALLALVGPGDVWLGVLLYIVGTIGFEGGYVFYNAFLPEVSTPKTIGRVSGWSWGTGYLGGLLALVACVPLLAGSLIDPDTGEIVGEAVRGYRLAFLVVAAFFAAFSVPSFLFLRERGTRRRIDSPLDYVRVGFGRVRETLAHLRQHREIAKFILAAVFFYGGIDAVVKFSGIYATRTFGFDSRELLELFIFANIVAAPGTLLAGYVADRLGARRTLLWILAGWVVLLLWGAMAQTKPGFWVLATGVSVGMGATSAIARSFMAQMSPDSRESEFFGFYLLAGKTGAIVAFLVFGVVSSVSGDQRTAVLWLVPLFVVGFGILLSIPARSLPANST